MSTLRTPPTRILRVYKLDANPFGFGFVFHEVNELPVRPLVELFDGRRTLPNMRQVLERDVLAVVCPCFFENPVSDVMESVTKIP